MSAPYRICSNCIMDTTDPDIEFDARGLCNHCRRYHQLARKKLLGGAEGQRRLQQIAAEIKQDGKHKEYDCIIGLSGGLDSSFAAYHAKRLGLRPLAVHVDNGWNSEISVRNVRHIIQHLNFDLYTDVLDWEEFRDVQLSFLRASVPDIEMVTDYGIRAVLLNLAKEKRIRYILTGANLATEAIMPLSWVFLKWDFRHIKAIHRRFGRKDLRRLPACGLFHTLVRERMGRVRLVGVLDYVDYNKRKAMEILRQQLDWQDYGGKHYESIFTRFYQAYILPKKYNIDKRRAHLSTLICSGQISREQALEEMKKPLYPLEQLEQDREYVLGKLGLTDSAFQAIMERPARSHFDYPNSVWAYTQFGRIIGLITRVVKLARGVRAAPRTDAQTSPK